jgi:exonuclease III
MFALTVTWITPSTTSAEPMHSVPTGFSLLRFPRLISPSNKSKIIGGGTALLVDDSCQILSSSSPVLNHLKILIVTLKFSKSTLTVFNVYRPSPSSTKAVPFSQFLTDFQTLVSLAARPTTSHKFLITGDFNVHLDDTQNSQTNHILSVLKSANLVQLATGKLLTLISLLLTLLSPRKFLTLGYHPQI